MYARTSFSIHKQWLIYHNEQFPAFLKTVLEV